MYKPFVKAFIIITFFLAAGNFLYAGDAVVLDIKPPATKEPIGNFHGNGILQKVDDNMVVIDDALYHLVPGVTYHDYNGSSSSATAFPVGIRVWFVLQHGNKDTIESLWKEGG